MKVEARPVTDRDIIITLTEREAGVILTVCGKIGGCPDTTDRRVWDKLAEALREHGVRNTSAEFALNSTINNTIYYR